MKSEIIKKIREFFHSRGFREIIVPMFNTSLPLEPNIYAFKVGDYFLPTSPEAALKKAIARGAGNCFAVGSAFRDLEGASKIHKPEFLMLEWYRKDADYKKIMRECEELISYINFNKKIKSPWQRISLAELFRKYAKLSLPEIIDDKKIYEVAKKRGFKTKNATWEQILNQIFLNEIDKHLPKAPFFLTDYPAKISPLCAKQRDKPYLAQRFELYINGIEIANGNTENTDAEEVLDAMKNEEKYRKKKGLICPPIDMEFIEALRFMNKKSYAGIGLGVERLTMVINEVADINKLT